MGDTVWDSLRKLAEGASAEAQKKLAMRVYDWAEERHAPLIIDALSSGKVTEHQALMDLAGALERNSGSHDGNDNRLLKLLARGTVQDTHAERLIAKVARFNSRAGKVNVGFAFAALKVLAARARIAGNEWNLDAQLHVAWIVADNASGKEMPKLIGFLAAGHAKNKWVQDTLLLALTEKMRIGQLEALEGAFPAICKSFDGNAEGIQSLRKAIRKASGVISNFTATCQSVYTGQEACRQTARPRQARQGR